MASLIYRYRLDADAEFRATGTKYSSTFSRRTANADSDARHAGKALSKAVLY